MSALCGNPPAEPKLFGARLQCAYAEQAWIKEQLAVGIGAPQLALVEYLRPETLFGNKFESYLNAKVMPQTNPNAYTNAYTNANTNAAAQPIDAEGHMAQCTEENGWF